MLPILYQSPDFILYSYPLLMGIGWGVGYQIFFSFLNPGFSKFKAQLLFWGIFLSSWLGAKILFLLSIPDSSEKLIRNFSFWLGGGFVFYGGLLASLLFLGIFKLLDKKLVSKDLWPMVPALVFGHAIGRIGCFLAGCCFGKPTEFFWGVHMHDHDRHPTQLLEAFGLLLIGALIVRKKIPTPAAATFYLVSYGGLRLVIEVLRGDTIRGHWGIMTPSQWTSCLMVLTGLVIYKYKHLAWDQLK
jgi:phosphatidylglycerol:prolipoprotein diacylglycerol transferase